MSCPPVKSWQVQNQLCELLYYPGKCSNRCNKMYQRWLREEEEVRRLEGMETEVSKTKKIVLDRKRPSDED